MVNGLIHSLTHTHQWVARSTSTSWATVALRKVNHLPKDHDVVARVTHGSVPRWRAPGGCRTVSPAWWTHRSCLQRECTLFRVSHVHFSVWQYFSESARYLPLLCVPPCGCRSWGGRGCCGWWRPELLEYPNHCERAESVVNTWRSWMTHCVKNPIKLFAACKGLVSSLAGSGWASYRAATSVAIRILKTLALNLARFAKRCFWMR